MPITNRKLRLLSVVALLSVTVLAACAMPARQWRASTPAPCTDSTYLQLRRQHPDSLSDREWQRFQSLDAACADARTFVRELAVNRSGHSGWMGLHHVGAAAGLVMTAIMASMMITMW